MHQREGTDEGVADGEEGEGVDVEHEVGDLVEAEAVHEKVADGVGEDDRDDEEGVELHGGMVRDSGVGSRLGLNAKIAKGSKRGKRGLNAEGAEVTQSTQRRGGMKGVILPQRLKSRVLGFGPSLIATARGGRTKARRMRRKVVTEGSWGVQGHAGAGDGTCMAPGSRLSTGSTLRTLRCV